MPTFGLFMTLRIRRFRDTDIRGILRVQSMSHNRWVLAAEHFHLKNASDDQGFLTILIE